MAGLAIQPHPRRDSRLAVLALSLVALGSFAAGMARQVVPAGPSPFPHASLSSLQRMSAIPVATPAPTLQVAEAEPRPARRAAPAEPPDPPPDISAALPPPATAPVAAATAPTVAAEAATDTAAVAADPPAAPVSAPNSEAAPPV